MPSLNGGESDFFFKLGEEKTVGANSRVLLSDNTIWWGGSMDDSLRHTGPFDPQLPVLAFRGADNKLRALLYNHSTHTIGTRQAGRSLAQLLWPGGAGAGNRAGLHRLFSGRRFGLDAQHHRRSGRRGGAADEESRDRGTGHGRTAGRDTTGLAQAPLRVQGSHV